VPLEFYIRLLVHVSPYRWKRIVSEALALQNPSEKRFAVVLHILAEDGVLTSYVHYNDFAAAPTSGDLLTKSCLVSRVSFAYSLGQCSSNGMKTPAKAAIELRLENINV
jgi:hypothetical protein